MNKHPSRGMVTAIAMPLLYTMAAVLTLGIAYTILGWAWAVWTDGLLVPGMEWSHEDGRVFTRRTDMVLAFVLFVIGGSFTYLGMVAVLLPIVVLRDRRRREAAMIVRPLATFPILAAALAEACRGIGKGSGAGPRLPSSLVLTTGTDLYLGPRPRFAALFHGGKATVTMGLTLFFLVNGDSLTRVLRSQARFLAGGRQAGVRAGLEALCELFWGMASIREHHAVDLQGEPQFPPAPRARWCILFPALAGFLLVWLRQARAAVEPTAGREALEPPLRKIRLFRTRAVGGLDALCMDDGRLFLPDNLPLFVMNGFRLARLHLGAFRYDATEELPADSLAFLEPAFEKACLEATRAAYRAHNLDGASRISVDACIDHMNERFATDPLFG